MNNIIESSSQELADGSTAYYDAYGRLAYAVDRNGNLVQPDTTVWSDFQKGVLGSLSGAIREAFAPRSPAAPAATGGEQQRNERQLVVVAALVLGGFLLYKALK